MSKIIVTSSLILVTTVFIVDSGVFAQSKSEESPPYRLSDADNIAIQDIVKDQETAWNEHDMVAFTKSYRNDAEGINIVGMYWRGKPELLKHLSNYHETIFKDLEETVEEVKVHSIGNGYAIAVSIWNVGAFIAPNGMEIPASRHRSTLVFAKESDGWKVVHFHNTTIDEAAVKTSADVPSA